MTTTRATKYGPQEILAAWPATPDPRQLLLALTAEDDVRLLKANRTAQTLLALTRRRGITAANNLRTVAGKRAFQRYLDLGPVGRPAFARIAGWKRAWTAVYPLLTDEAWFLLAKMSLSLRAFDVRGGGIWLAKRRPKLYRDVREKTLPCWGRPIAADGEACDSVAEAIHASFLFHNRDKIRYSHKPKLPFYGEGRRAPRPCVGDFYVEVLPHVDAVVRQFYVENWMSSLDLRPACEDTIVVAAVGRRHYKERGYAARELPLVNTEADIYRTDGADAFLRHLQEAYFLQAGVQLSIAGIKLPVPLSSAAVSLSSHEIALLLYTRGLKTVNIAKGSKVSRIRALASQIVLNRLTETVELELAALQGRMPRTRMRAGAWESTVTKEVVWAYCRERKLNLPLYRAAHLAAALPAGFPASPRQQWPEWSWREVRGDVPSSKLVRDYVVARAMLQRWQHRTGIALVSQGDYERERKRSRWLRQLPKLPDNRKSGGLDGWKDWDDFLGSRAQQMAADRLAYQDRLVDEIENLDAPGAARVLVREKLQVATDLASFSRLYRKLRERSDWEDIRLHCGQRKLLVKDPAAIRDMFRRKSIRSLYDFCRRRADDAELMSVPYHVERILTPEVRASLFVP